VHSDQRMAYETFLRFALCIMPCAITWNSEFFAMNQLRTIIDTRRRGSRNMALDYAVLKAVSQEASLPTLRIYQWEVPTITLGYFQTLAEEVYVDACRQDRVPVIRRITGGGTVLHDMELTYSVVVSEKAGPVKGSVLDSYKAICDPVIKAMNGNGVKAEFKPANDILVSDMKISGSAQTRKQGVILQHGTILLDLNMDRMRRYLKTGKRKDGVQPRAVTCLNDHIKTDGTGEKFTGKLSLDISAAFGRCWQVGLVPGTFSVPEKTEALRIEKEIFLNPDWNEKREAGCDIFNVK